MSITLRMYAERKGWALEDTKVRLTHERLDAGNGEGGRDAIRTALWLKGDLDPDQRQRLLKIAARCWMHRSLASGIELRLDQDRETPLN